MKWLIVVLSLKVKQLHLWVIDVVVEVRSTRCAKIIKHTYRREQSDQNIRQINA
jgi:hypothetical protein